MTAAFGALVATLALVGSLGIASPAVAAPVDAAAPVADAAAASSPAVDAGIVKAAAVVGFNAENIISDALFYDGNAMSAAEIQSFLDAKIGACQNGKCLNVLQVDGVSANAYYSVTTGNLVCNAISGGRMRVSEWIYRVQRSCGISAKVILVTLQKEQGLISGSSAQAPSDYRLLAAMGHLCPDTARCDPSVAGPVLQIFKGVEQLKKYKATAFGKQPGRNYVGYSPTASCGGTYLNIQNYATAALYNYTPYQPNAASLAAGYGYGDSCSSYGNRNFYNYYTQWFGSTQNVGGERITARWQALGGAASVLGNPTSAVVCGKLQNGCYQNFQQGAISWTSSTGAWETLGAIRARWSALSFEDGVLGYPTGAPTCGTRDGGCYQNFQNGAISSTASTGTWETYGAIRSRWQALKFETGVLGYPVGAPVCGLIGGGCYQDYQAGAITWTAAVGAWETFGDIRARWKATGFENGVLGYPVGVVTCGMKESGCYQAFQNGAITWAPAVGAWETYGPIRARWSAADFERGQLGFPTGAPVTANGISHQSFQGGAIGWSSGSGAFVSTGVIGERWLKIGASLSPLGAPIGVVTCGTRDRGCYQNFQKGAISTSASTAAWETYGVIRTRWQADGFENGALGYPTGAPQTVDGGLYQEFQGGAIGWSSAAGTFVSSGTIGERWIALGGATGVLGTPMGAITCGTRAGGCYQDFRGGAISSSPFGTWETSGVIRTRWKETGFESGVLGYPIGAPVCGTKGGGCYQDFEHGAISWTKDTGAWDTYGVIRDFWRAQDFERGPLGYPLSAAVTDASGSMSQRFEGGVVVVTSGVAVLTPSG